MSCSPEWTQPPQPLDKGAPSLYHEGHGVQPSASSQDCLQASRLLSHGAGAQQMGLMQQDLTPGPLPSSPSSGFRSYPLRGSHSLDDLLDRPGNSTASSEYWDGQSRSRTQSRVPSRAPSPTPAPLPGSRRGSMGSVGVASEAKVSPSPSLSSTLGLSRDRDQRPGNPLCFATESSSGPSHPSLTLPICAGRGGMGL